jgi:hypothetical protein
LTCSCWASVVRLTLTSQPDGSVDLTTGSSISTGTTRRISKDHAAALGEVLKEIGIAMPHCSASHVVMKEIAERGPKTGN